MSDFGEGDNGGSSSDFATLPSSSSSLHEALREARPSSLLDLVISILCSPDFLLGCFLFPALFLTSRAFFAFWARIDDDDVETEETKDADDVITKDALEISKAGVDMGRRVEDNLKTIGDKEGRSKDDVKGVEKENLEIRGMRKRREEERRIRLQASEADLHRGRLEPSTV